MQNACEAAWFSVFTSPFLSVNSCIEASHPPTSPVNYLKPNLSVSLLSLQAPGEAIIEEKFTLLCFQSDAERRVSCLLLRISHVLKENPFTVEFSVSR